WRCVVRRRDCGEFGVRCHAFSLRQARARHIGCRPDGALTSAGPCLREAPPSSKENAPDSMSGAFCRGAPLKPRISVLEGVLYVLASVLRIGLRLVGPALVLLAPVAGGLAHGFLGLALNVLHGVLDLIGAAHSCSLDGRFRTFLYGRCAR